MSMSTKPCTKCKKNFPATRDFFYKSSKHKDGLSGYCKTCQQLCNKKWASENRSRRNAYQREWESKNKERLSLYKQKRRNTVKGLEAQIRDKLADKLKGRVEVKTPAGFIDILTDTQLIEVKASIAWKSGIGQLIAYQMYHKEHEMRLHLFKPRSGLDFDVINTVCDRLGIVLTLEVEE